MGDSNTDKPRVLVSNDDGVSAPGLRALAKALNAESAALDFSVCGPFGERSAQSHCITIGKHLHAFEIAVEGATEAFAVDGTPADSVMIALHGPVLQKNRHFDLVVSGINRGDNCGLHVIYSGTVGAAREAACKGIPAIAFSLDSHSARSEEQYESAAIYAITIIKAVLGLLPGSPVPKPLRSFAGYVINVNCPSFELSAIKGLHICHQGQHCSYPSFVECDADPHFTTKNETTYRELHMGEVTMKAYRNAHGYLQGDETPGADSWAVKNGFVALTLVGLLSDVPLTLEAAGAKMNSLAGGALVEITKRAAAALNVEAAGIPDGLL